MKSSNVKNETIDYTLNDTTTLSVNDLASWKPDFETSEQFSSSPKASSAVRPMLRSSKSLE